MLDLQKVIIESNRRQTVEDLELLQRCCRKIEARTILEIGSADGGSSVVLGAEAKATGGHLYCIEPQPKGRMVENMRRHELAGCFTLIPKASPWVPVDILPEQFDLLFIDGYHQVRWALVDYHYFDPRVRVGGIIVFHDYSGQCAEDKRRPDYGKPGYVGLVRRAVDIVCETDTHLKQIDLSVATNGGAIAFEKGAKQ